MYDSTTDIQSQLSSKMSVAPASVSDPEYSNSPNQNSSLGRGHKPLLVLSVESDALRGYSGLAAGAPTRRDDVRVQVAHGACDAAHTEQPANRSTMTTVATHSHVFVYLVCDHQSDYPHGIWEEFAGLL
jgi:hypothetical protein